MLVLLKGYYRLRMCNDYKVIASMETVSKIIQIIKVEGSLKLD